jgi:hypothetical protein
MFAFHKIGHISILLYLIFLISLNLFVPHIATITLIEIGVHFALELVKGMVGASDVCQFLRE